jgi:ParB-like chromosome segregation protein Spo0J
MTIDPGQDTVTVDLEADEAATIAVADVVFRKDLYPRLEHDSRKVDQYAEDLTVLPPIEVNQRRELIDGWHRWTAHRKAGAERVPVLVTETDSDEHLLELAIRRNASHGLQLSAEDKRDMARRIYNSTAEREREAKKAALASMLSVSQRTVRGWLSRIDKDAKEARDRRVFGRWLACSTHEEIAKAEGVSETSVREAVSAQTADVPSARKADADHATDFEPPIYNIWKQQTKTAGGSHFGNSEVRWVDNLLYLYTQPFDIVIDPFAGSGSTADVCKKRMRRYWVSDRKPAVGREDVIREHDLTEGLPKLPRWQDVSLVYLDPPYWKQAEGEYSDDAQDLANMSLDEFNDTLAGTIRDFAKKLKPGAHIALIIQPTQWKSPNREVTDHIADMLRAVKLPVAARISAPYESQQYNAQQVEWAKANRKILVLTREIVVWRVE